MNLRRLEEISQNASRAERGLMIDGWAVGLSRGLAHRRSRCVNPFYASTRPFAENFALARAVFAEAHLPYIFRITPFVSDPNIDAELAARGFQRIRATLVQVLPLAQLQLDHVRATDATFQSAPDVAQAAAWLTQMRGDSAGETAALRERWRLCVARIDASFAYNAAGERIARSVAIGEDGHVGIFDVGTLDAWRHRGYATALIAQQLCNAREAGAHTAYLQVEPDNSSLSIYQRFGFRTAYEYWYRVLPEDAH